MSLPIMVVYKQIRESGLRSAVKNRTFPDIELAVPDLFRSRTILSVRPPLTEAYKGKWHLSIAAKLR